ncbi:hypothetical protein EfmAA290_11080 [Enterococcus faecium]|nr:hypothetical protein EfmAA290_11080 [Enterococcus faecium]
MENEKRIARSEKNYSSARLTTIEDEIEEIKIDTQVLVAQEDVIVSVTREGYVKRTSLWSSRIIIELFLMLREGDYLLYSGELSTLDHVLLITICKYVESIKYFV